MEDTARVVHNVVPNRQNHAPNLPEYAGKRRRAYVFFCDTCGRRDMIYAENKTVSELTLNIMLRDIGWTRHTKRRNWRCPDCSPPNRFTAFLRGLAQPQANAANAADADNA